MAELVKQVGNSAYDELIGGTYPPTIIGGAIIANGAGELKRGTVLGKITASGKYTKADSAATDGSNVGSAVLVEDVDATDGDVTTEIYISGMFNRNKLIFGGSDTADKQEDNLRIHNIYFSAFE